MNYTNYWNDMRLAIDQLDHAKIKGAHSMIVDCASRGNNIFTGGNGGSASTAEHASCDISKGMSSISKIRFPVFPLMSNVSLNSAWSNDEVYENAMARILDSMGRTGDLLILISGSGNSKNVIKAAQVAVSLGIEIIALTGFDGGQLAKFANIEIRVESNDMQVIENAHLAVIHSFLKISF